MHTSLATPQRSGVSPRELLAERLEARRAEIEQTVLARVYSVADPSGVSDPEYVSGLRQAVTAAVAYGLSGVRQDAVASVQIPAELFVQVRLAVRNGVPLDTILRRYVAGHTVLGDFLMCEAEEVGGIDGGELQRLARAQASLFDRLVEAMAGEYRDEIEARSRSLHQRRAECVRRLLAGELADPGELGYELSGWHVGVVAAGVGAEEAVRNLAAAIDRRLLFVPRGDGAVWGWLGGSGRVEDAAVAEAAAGGLPGAVLVALGAPAEGRSGWRLTHRQAADALAVARRSRQPVTRYAEVGMVASMLRDEVLLTTLDALYIAPLAADRDGGETLRETLRAYFAAGRNVSSAAAALGVNRHTVSSRLLAVEERLGRQLSVCAVELETALRLEELGSL